MLEGLTHRLVTKVEKKSGAREMNSSVKLSNQYKTQFRSKGSYIPSPQTFVYPNKFWKIAWQMIIVCLSPFYVGVTIYLSIAYSFESYQRYYNFISYPPVLTFTTMNACVPLGGVLGSLTFPIVMRNAGKMNVITVFLIGSLICCGITINPVYQVLIVGRFLLGVICSWQQTFAAVFIKQLSPVQYRAMFGGLFFTARCSGMTLTCLIAFCFWWQLNNVEIILINLLPLYIALLQWVLFKIFIKQTPAQLSRNNQENLRPYFLRLYSQQDVEKAIQNCMRQFKTMQSLYSYVNARKTQKQRQLATTYYERMLNRILFLSLEVSSVRQIVGVTYVTNYGKMLLHNMGCSYRYALSGPIQINIFQVVASLVGMYLCHKFNRRPLLLVGVAGSLIGTLIIGFTNLQNNYFGQISGMIIYMIFVGGMLQPVAWSYASDLLLIGKFPLSSLSNWVSASVIAGVPMRSQIYQFMFAISAYLLINLIILYFSAIQIKDMTTRQIITQIMQQAFMQVKRNKNVVQTLSNIQSKSYYKKSTYTKSKFASQIDLKRVRSSYQLLIQKQLQNKINDMKSVAID